MCCRGGISGEVGGAEVGFGQPVSGKGREMALYRQRVGVLKKSFQGWGHLLGCLSDWGQT